MITSKEEIRYLDRPAPDELARWQKDYKKSVKNNKKIHTDEKFYP